MDYGTNSHKSKEQAGKPDITDKKIEKVVSGDVISKKKPLGRRFKDVFFGGEFKGAARYITADVLLPALRNLIVDAVEGGIRRMVYGESGPRSRRPEYRPRVSYNNPVQRGISSAPSRVHLPDQPPHPFRQNRQESNDIIISTREDAEMVLERLIEIIERYDVASLADFYELVGLPSAHTDNKWGWSHLAGVSIRQVRDGFMLELPNMEPI